MTQRKPPGMSVAGWVEQQIRTADRNGEFDNLPGQGRPIAGLQESRPELAWVAEKLRRENVSIAALLPPALALAKEVEDLPVHLASLKSESAVRSAVADLNHRIVTAHRIPHDGPPVRVMPRDVERLVEDWQVQRSARLAERAAELAALVDAAPIPARRGPRAWLLKSLGRSD